MREPPRIVTLILVGLVAALFAIAHSSCATVKRLSPPAVGATAGIIVAVVVPAPAGILLGPPVAAFITQAAHPDCAVLVEEARAEARPRSSYDRPEPFDWRGWIAAGVLLLAGILFHKPLRRWTRRLLDHHTLRRWRKPPNLPSRAHYHQEP